MHQQHRPATLRRRPPKFPLHASSHVICGPYDSCLPTSQTRRLAILVATQTFYRPSSKSDVDAWTIIGPIYVEGRSCHKGGGAGAKMRGEHRCSIDLSNRSTNKHTAQQNETTSSVAKRTITRAKKRTPTGVGPSAPLVSSPLVPSTP